MEKVLNEAFEGHQKHSCVSSNEGFHFYHQSEIGQGGGLNNLEMRGPPQTVKIKCIDRSKDETYYLGKLTGKYYRITQHLSVYEPYFFYMRDFTNELRVFVIGKFYPYRNKQSNIYNAMVFGIGSTIDSVTTHLRVAINLNTFFSPLWGHRLVDHGEWRGSTMILHQERFLHFSKEIEMMSTIKEGHTYTVIRDKEMTYKLDSASRPILATGQLFLLDKFYEARAEIPESSWREFVEDFFTFDKIPFTSVPMAGFGKVLLEAIKTLKVSIHKG